MAFQSIVMDPSSRNVIKKVRSLQSRTETQIRGAMYDFGKRCKSSASMAILKKPKGGRTYVSRGKLGRRRRHVSSAPGESWANRSGEARRGILFNVVGSEKLIFGNNVKHAKFLENGTKRMEARPAHLNAINKNKAQGIRSIELNLEDVF